MTAWLARQIRDLLSRAYVHMLPVRPHAADVQFVDTDAPMSGPEEHCNVQYKVTLKVSS